MLVLGKAAHAEEDAKTSQGSTIYITKGKIIETENTPTAHQYVHEQLLAEIARRKVIGNFRLITGKLGNTSMHKQVSKAISKQASWRQQTSILEAPTPAKLILLALDRGRLWQPRSGAQGASIQNTETYTHEQAHYMSESTHAQAQAHGVSQQQSQPTLETYTTSAQ